jgi:hypothetical protein
MYVDCRAEKSRIRTQADAYVGSTERQYQGRFLIKCREPCHPAIYKALAITHHKIIIKDHHHNDNSIYSYYTISARFTI